MERKIYTARLLQKSLLSEPAQCFHLQFAVEDQESFNFLAGQFVSMVATDTRGKQQTRAYSIASAQRDSGGFDLCLNRVEGGFFSNMLADLNVGNTVQFHGPHGLFTLPSPLTDAIMIATGTGVAPMRSFVEHLFPANQPDRSQGRSFWLVYGTRHESEVYYQSYFEKMAAEHPNFHYLPTLSRALEGWEGLRGYVQAPVRELLEQYVSQTDRATENAVPSLHAYICGLNDMVSANRELLKEMGLEKKQIHFERYD
ncbi:MAG TPA: FAD-dependent oxidoreductase [Acidobacteriaceae bacterium]|nr:FAD-dependent oxidoreductase [Acidobacteriaceae bacterium]